MLYPMFIKNSKENLLIEKLNDLKNWLYDILKAITSYNSFMLFLKQKFHF